MRREASVEAKRWLDQAREDLKWAKKLAEDGGFQI
jgi:HEPN domain-containing protein